MGKVEIAECKQFLFFPACCQMFSSVQVLRINKSEWMNTHFQQTTLETLWEKEKLLFIRIPLFATIDTLSLIAIFNIFAQMFSVICCRFVVWGLTLFYMVMLSDTSAAEDLRKQWGKRKRNATVFSTLFNNYTFMCKFLHISAKMFSKSSSTDLL